MPKKRDRVIGIAKEDIPAGGVGEIKITDNQFLAEQLEKFYPNNTVRVPARLIKID